MQNSATAWLNIEADEIQRGSSRSTTMPSVRRPVTANTVISETDSAACARPDQRLHECDLVHDEGDLRDEREGERAGHGPERQAAQRVAPRPQRLGGLRRRGRCACDGTHRMTTGTRITTITAAAINIAV